MFRLFKREGMAPPPSTAPTDEEEGSDGGDNAASALAPAVGDLELFYGLCVGYLSARLDGRLSYAVQHASTTSHPNNHNINTDTAPTARGDRLVRFIRLDPPRRRRR